MGEAFKAGLEGVVAGQSNISRVDPQMDKLLYRGYDAMALAQSSSFEEVAFLLLFGELPDAAELAKFRGALAAARRLPDPVYRIIREIPTGTHPMDAARTGVSALSHFDPDTTKGDHAANLRKAVRLVAQTPIAVGAFVKGEEAARRMAADPRLSLAEGFLRLLTSQAPIPSGIRLFDASMVLYAEHGFNASTFSARVTCSTLSDIHAAVTAGIGTLKGPLHGGANEEAMAMLLEIGRPENVDPYVRARLARKEKIMGFGHRVYKKQDSRYPGLKEMGRRWAAEVGGSSWFEMLDRLEAIITGEKGICANVDLATAPIYYLMGIPINLYTPIFVAARMSGWCAHVIEQLDNNRLYRPLSEYTGPAYRPYVPLAERSGGGDGEAARKVVEEALAGI